MYLCTFSNLSFLENSHLQQLKKIPEALKSVGLSHKLISKVRAVMGKTQGIKIQLGWHSEFVLKMCKYPMCYGVFG